MSTFGPIVNRRSVVAAGTITQWEPVKSTTEDSENNGLSVLKASATTSVVIGFALDSVTSGQGLEIALPGQIVLMRCGSAGVAIDVYVGLDSGDPTEIVALTLDGTQTTQRQILGRSLRAGVENDLIPVLFNPFVTEV